MNNYLQLQNPCQKPAMATRIHGWRHTLLGVALTVLGLATSLSDSVASPVLDGHTQISTAVHDFIAGHYPDAVQLSEGNAAATSGRRVEIDVPRLDPRLSIQSCQMPLQVRLNQNQTPLGKISVRVDCQDAAPWSRYIPASVRVYQQVVFSARPLTRGSVIAVTDLQVSEVDIASVRGSWLADTDMAVGKEVRRTLPSGVAITAEALTEQELIARGQTVVLTAQKGTVLIRQQGVALQAGESGKQISVRNSNSGRVVQAVVTGPGEVEVLF